MSARRIGMVAIAGIVAGRVGQPRFAGVERVGERLPLLAAAFSVGELGVAAVSLLVRIVTPATGAVWVDRARRRTVKHLAEEVVEGRDLRVAS